MKCELCKQTLAETFLKKIEGTYIKDEKSKLHVFCRHCQQRFPQKHVLLQQLR